MVVNPKIIKYFELTKNFKKEVRDFVQNNSSLEDKIYDCILDFEKNLYLSKYYRKPLKNGEFKKFNLHELQIGGDFRIIIQIKISINKDGSYTCYFINFGTHSSLNLVGNKKLKINPIR
ncbi:MAG: hypothetical protein PHV23_00635 [Candidatus Gracilibacteria bacterium]|nr:hypothetical protein [Candidatus Gracilibacteria bacterium]